MRRRRSARMARKIQPRAARPVKSAGGREAPNLTWLHQLCAMQIYVLRDLDRNNAR